VNSKLVWFYKNWRRFKIVSIAVSILWTIHMFWWGATQHIPGQSQWDTAGAACYHALSAGFVLWLGSWFCWFGAGLTTVAIETGHTLGERVRILTMAFTIAGLTIGCIVGQIGVAIWTTGYAAPIK
jgi:hypothetical protein